MRAQLTERPESEDRTWLITAVARTANVENWIPQAVEAEPDSALPLLVAAPATSTGAGRHVPAPAPSTSRATSSRSSTTGCGPPRRCSTRWPSASRSGSALGTSSR
ncbi:hypothetical protein ACFQVA_39070 [Actinomadura keratinilytica]